MDHTLRAGGPAKLDLAQGFFAGAVARKHAVGVRDVEQVRDLAHVVILVDIEPAVGEGNAPQVLDEVDALGHGVLALDRRDGARRSS